MVSSTYFLTQIYQNNIDGALSLAYDEFKELKPTLAEMVTKLTPHNSDDKEDLHGRLTMLGLEEKSIEEEVKKIQILKSQLQKFKDELIIFEKHANEIAEKNAEEKIFSSIDSAVQTAINEYKSLPTHSYIDGIISDKKIIPFPSATDSKNTNDYCSQINDTFNLLYTHIGTNSFIDILDKHLTKKLNQLTPYDSKIKIFTIKKLGVRKITLNNEVKQTIINRCHDIDLENEIKEKQSIIFKIDKHKTTLIDTCESKILNFIKDAFICIQSVDNLLRLKEKNAALTYAQESLDDAAKIKDNIILISKEPIEFNKFFNSLEKEGITDPVLVRYLRHDVLKYLGEDEKLTPSLQRNVGRATGIIDAINSEYKKLKEINPQSKELKLHISACQDTIKGYKQHLRIVESESINEQDKFVESLQSRMVPIITTLIAINNAIDIIHSEKNHLLEKKGCWLSGKPKKALQIEDAIARSLKNIDSLVNDKNKNDLERIQFMLKYKKEKKFSISESLQIKRHVTATPHMYTRVLEKVNATFQEARPEHKRILK